MKIIASHTVGATLSLTYPSTRTMAALTNGGFGRLPGDAVTADLAENSQRRAAVAASMPVDRAVENSVRAGRDRDFAGHWYTALVIGGETEATALELIRQKDAPPEMDHAAIDPEDVPGDRFFRDAWRWDRGIYVDLDAAREIFARAVISAKAAALAEMAPRIEQSVLLGKPSDALEARFAALKAMNLHRLRDAIAKADTPEELRAAWPADLATV